MRTVRAVTPREAVTEACFRARNYQYLPDEVVTPDGVVVPIDVWGTLREFEARRGGDCDDFTCSTIEIAERAAPDGAYWFVAGEVLVRGQWIGHAWVEIETEDARLWADPTWGRVPQPPSTLGYPASRRPWKRWHYAGKGLFDHEETYVGAA